MVGIVGMVGLATDSVYTFMEITASDTMLLRAKAVADIRQRVGNALGSWLSDEESLLVSIASGIRQAPELLDYLLNPTLAKRAKQNVKATTMTAEEWVYLFGPEARPTRTQKLDRAVSQKAFEANTEKLRAALRCTVEEAVQKAVWARTWTKASCFVALHVHEPEVVLGSCLNSIVRADLRRIEDLRADIDDAGIQTMMLAEVMEALAQSVT